jgi:hypothetical protein
MKKKGFVKISWETYAKDCLLLSKKIKGIKIDKIIAISRGGLVAARIFSDLLSLPISHMTISSYTDWKQQTEPMITEVPMRVFRDETILIIDEVSDTGKTFKRALSYFKNFPVKKIYTLSPYIKPKTAFTPDFWQKNINSWIIFPYDLKETYEAFIKIYKSREKTIAEMRNLGFKKWEMENI